MTRRGVSLLELLLVLALLGVTAVITLAMVAGAGRAARRTALALATERTTGSLAALLRHDARIALLPDWQLTSPAEVRYHRPVGGGPVCTNSTGTGTVTIRRSAWLGERAPAPGRDRVLLLSAPALAWTTATILDVGSTSCPDGGAAWQLTTAGAPPDPLHALVVEPIRLAAYTGTGGTWLGLAGPGDPIQPFAGPLEPGGMTLTIAGGALMAELTPRGAASRTLRIPVPVP